jgi:hypothetical protein
MELQIEKYFEASILYLFKQTGATGRIQFFTNLKAAKFRIEAINEAESNLGLIEI